MEKSLSYVSEDSGFPVKRPHKNENFNSIGSDLLILYYELLLNISH